MGKKNANGDGSIYQRADGLWCANVSLGYDKDGSRKRKVIYDRDRKKLKEKMIDLQNDIMINDGYVRDDVITLRQWSMKYLEEFIKPKIRAGTYDSYHTLCRNHIFNHNISDMKLKDIKAYHLQTYMNSKTHMSKSTIKKIHILLNTFFEEATKNDLIRKNPMSSVNRPTSDKEVKEIEIMDLDEQKRYVNSIEKSSYRGLLLTALFTGMRLGELQALTWNNIDLSKKEIRVVSSFRETRIHNSDGTLSWTTLKQPPKTKSGIRTIPIPDLLIKELIAHRTKQSERAMKLGRDDFNKENLVFCSDIGTPLNQRNIQRAHKQICAKAKINPTQVMKKGELVTEYGIGFHALRHTFATRMIERNVDIKTVQVWLGHSTIQMTYNIYVKVQEDTKKAAASVQDDLFASLL